MERKPLSMPLPPGHSPKLCTLSLVFLASVALAAPQPGRQVTPVKTASALLVDERAQELETARKLLKASPPQTHAALGHYMVALAMTVDPYPSFSSAEHQKKDIFHQRTAALEAAELLRALRPEAKVAIAELLKKSGPRGLLQLATITPHLDTKRELLRLAIMAGAASEMERPAVESAALEAGRLLNNPLIQTPHPIAARWLFSFAGAEGQRELSMMQAPAFPVATHQPSSEKNSPSFSNGVNADVLASQLFGDFHTGELLPLDDDPVRPPVYALLARAAKFEWHTQAMYPSLNAITGTEEKPSEYRIALVAFHQDDRDAISVTLVSEPGILKAPSLESCLIPPKGNSPIDEQPSPNADYNNLGNAAGWLSNSKRFFEVSAVAYEGYAGGGARFDASVVIDTRGGKLVPVGCFQTGVKQSLAGDWLPNGQRKHEELSMRWNLSVKSAKTDYPPIVFSLSGTKVQRTATWSATTQQYLFAP